jgi:ABC-type transport system substrate-binding protein
VALLVAGCLSTQPTPSPSPTASATPTPTVAAGTGDTLRIAVAEEPTALTPVARDASSRRVTAFLYDALYRLDGRFVAEPRLAVQPPAISVDGLTWTVAPRADVRFHDGSTLTAQDIVFTYQLALSGRCPFGELCRPVRDQLGAVALGGRGRVAFTLLRPSAAFMATVLAQVPVLPAAATQASLMRLLDTARAVDAAQVAELALRFDTATNDEACLGPDPPQTCDPAAYVPELEALLRKAGVSLPPRRLFTDAEGTLLAADYGAALAQLLDELQGTLETEGAEQAAAAYPLLDMAQRPVGSGPFRFGSQEPGVSLELIAFGDYFAGPVGPARLDVRVIPDPAAAATALKTGDLDWLPVVGREEVPGLEADPLVQVGAHVAGSYRAIVFNVRPGRPYADPEARAAFALCIDRLDLIRQATGGRAQPMSRLTWPDSWLATGAGPAEPERDPREARRRLEAAGWVRGGDGIYARDAVRLSSELLVRPSRGDLLGFARLAAEQLAECGIELRVRELAAGAGVLLEQLEWPNDFDTFLQVYELAPDPATDLEVFHSRHVTTEANPGDTNIGGWADSETDRLLEAGAVELELPARSDIYGRLLARLALLRPIYPLWYDVDYAAIAERVQGPSGPPDPSASRYDWQLAEWRLAEP